MRVVISHCVYRVTNILNGKFYIGKHSSNDMFDDYMGSGLAIMRAIKLHGKENFVKEVISEHRTSKEAYVAEKTEIAKHLGNRMCYNIADGGGGFQKGNVMSSEVRAKISASMKGVKKSQSARRKIIESRESAVEVLRKRIIQIDKETGCVIREFRSLTDAARFIGKGHASIGACARGERPSAYGYNWSYIQ